MKTISKTFLSVSLLLAAGVASAASINVSVSSSATAEADFLASLYSVSATENFDGFAPNGNASHGNANQQYNWEDRASVYSTNVGTFELMTAGQSSGNPHNDQLMIESSQTGEFGRQVLGSPGFWLDSNDAREVVWTLGAPLSGSFNAFGFHLADASDISANLTLAFADGSMTYVDMATIMYPEANGNLKYVTVTSDMSILGGTLTFANTSGNDGWGIDNVTVGNLPEPGTLLLMGLGLLGLGAARRRAAK